MNKEKFDRLAELKIQIKSLEDEAKELTIDVVAEMKREEVDKVDHEFGTFTLSGRKTWTFSERVEGIRTHLKDAEADEKADGTAKCETLEFIVFKANKQ